MEKEANLQSSKASGEQDEIAKAIAEAMQDEVVAEGQSEEEFVDLEEERVTEIKQEIWKYMAEIFAKSYDASNKDSIIRKNDRGHLAFRQNSNIFICAGKKDDEIVVRKLITYAGEDNSLEDVKKYDDLKSRFETMKGVYESYLESRSPAPVASSADAGPLLVRQNKIEK